MTPKILLVSLAVLALFGPSYAQEQKVDGKKSGAKARPNFTGNWVLDRDKSSLGRLEQALPEGSAMTVAITHNDPELRIIRNLSVRGQDRPQEFTYYTDGRGETNLAPFGNNEVKSKTKWDGSKLMSRSSSSFAARRGAGDVFFTDTTEKRELSADGKVLTITVSISGPQGTRVVKQVFNRAP